MPRSFLVKQPPGYSHCPLKKRPVVLLPCTAEGEYSSADRFISAGRPARAAEARRSNRGDIFTSLILFGFNI
jgi:hypothetical protein